MIDRNYTSGTSNGTDATGARDSTEPRVAPDSATRGEPRGSARMNTSTPDAPFHWQADGAAQG